MPVCLLSQQRTRGVRACFHHFRRPSTHPCHLFSDLWRWLCRWHFLICSPAPAPASASAGVSSQTPLRPHPGRQHKPSALLIRAAPRHTYAPSSTPTLPLGAAARSASPMMKRKRALAQQSQVHRRRMLHRGHSRGQGHRTEPAPREHRHMCRPFLVPLPFPSAPACCLPTCAPNDGGVRFHDDRCAHLLQLILCQLGKVLLHTCKCVCACACVMNNQPHVCEASSDQACS